MPVRAQLAESLLQCIEMGQMQCEQVDLVIVLKRTQLAAGDDPYPQPLTRRPRGGNAVDRIVIGEGQRGEPAPLGSFDYALGGKNSIRRGRVGMQVDVGRPARIRAHRS